MRAQRPRCVSITVRRKCASGTRKIAPALSGTAPGAEPADIAEPEGRAMISSRLDPVLSPGVPRFDGSPPWPSVLPRSSARRSREQRGTCSRGSCRVTARGGGTRKSDRGRSPSRSESAATLDPQRRAVPCADPAHPRDPSAYRHPAWPRVPSHPRTPPQGSCCPGSR